MTKIVCTVVFSRMSDENQFRNFTRLEPHVFDELLEGIKHLITKQDTNMRKAIEPGLKLACTLRFLATGQSYVDLQYSFRIGKNTASLFIPEVCRALVLVFVDRVIPVPDTPEEWKDIAEEFWLRWNMPNCLGALDGKHVRIKCPPNSGSLFFNYKKFYSIVLLGLADANYRFLWVDVGGNGAQSDAQIFNGGELKQNILDGVVGFPPPQTLPFDQIRTVPFFIIGDDAFGLQTYMMKPHGGGGLSYEEKIFNYRLSRARRVVENAFGIMSNNWRILLTCIQLDPDKTRDIVSSCVCLHNLSRMRARNPVNEFGDRPNRDGTVIEGEWRTWGMMMDMDRIGAPRNPTQVAKRQRQYLTQYFVGPGKVPWQDDMAHIPAHQRPT